MYVPVCCPSAIVMMWMVPSFLRSFVRSFVRYKSEQKGIKEQRQHYLDVAREHDATMALWYPTKNALVRFAGCEKNGGLATTPPPLLSETSEEFCKIPGISQRL